MTKQPTKCDTRGLQISPVPPNVPILAKHNLALRRDIATGWMLNGPCWRLAPEKHYWEAVEDAGGGVQWEVSTVTDPQKELLEPQPLPLSLLPDQQMGMYSCITSGSPPEP